jgi:hypothetical protein
MKYTQIAFNSDKSKLLIYVLYRDQIVPVLFSNEKGDLIELLTRKRKDVRKYLSITWNEEIIKV